MSLSWPGALRSQKIIGIEGGINRWRFLQRGMSPGKGCQQPVSLCSSRRELCPWRRGKAGIRDSRRGAIPGDGASCAPHVPPCGRRLLPMQGERAAPRPAGAAGGHTGPPHKGRGPPSPHPWAACGGSELQTTPRARPGPNAGEQMAPGARRGRRHA